MPTIVTAGNVGFSSSNTLIMELGGITVGSEFDQIQSSGPLAFGGTLQGSLINGFTPMSGQSFNLFDSISTSGTFTTVQFPSPAAGLTWNTSQLYTNGVLSVAAAGIPGDYNNNGTADAGAYVLRRKYNTATTLPNDSTPGTDNSDYSVWQSHFGQPSGSSAVMTGGVPEPATLVLLIPVAAGWCLLRRRPR